MYSQLIFSKGAKNMHWGKYYYYYFTLQYCIGFALKGGDYDFLLHGAETIVTPPALEYLFRCHESTMNTQGRLPIVTGALRHCSTVKVRMKAEVRVISAATVRRVDG